MVDDYRRLVRAALGEIPCDLVVANARLVNVHTGQVQENTNIGIFGNKIAYIGEEQLSGRSTIDANGKYAVPGLIDTHVHIESSQITPPRFAEAVLPRGTTTVAIDPHEIANVMGTEGVRLMLDSSKNIRLKVFVMVPTCVPSIEELETAGANFTGKEVEDMLGWDRVIGLAEIMDYDAVIKLRERITGIIDVGREHHVVLDGHCMFLTGKPLNAYLSTGIEACHENFTSEAAVSKLRAGMDYVKIRNLKLMSHQFPGSTEDYIQKFVAGLNQIPDKRSILFCTDDIMPDVLLEEGHLDSVLRTLTSHGYDAIAAIQGATVGAANHLRLHDLGSITPGKHADILLLGGELEKFDIDTVIADGELVAKQGKLAKPIDIWRFPQSAKQSVKLRPPSKEDFYITAPIQNGTAKVRVIDMSSIITRFLIEEVNVENWHVRTNDLTTVAIFERHGKTGGKCLALARNAILDGAVASTISHDSHNLVVMGRNQEDMKQAVDSLIQMQGGVVVVEKGAVIATLHLPIAGLMSEQPIDEVAREMKEIRYALKRLGRDERGFLSFWAIGLPVVPSARLTDKVLVDSDNQKAVPLFVS
jgi:adenine deaminase